ncbi:MAG: ParA family protein [Actinomycetota bacterium]|nr:ParA family protein [Actinomycetota bacterium]
MRTLAVLSLKGGVGKTSVVLGLAGAALQRKIRTLVIDLDPQGNCTAALDPDATKSTLADVLADPEPSVLRSAIASSSWGEGLDVLVSAEEAEAHNGPAPDVTRLSWLDHALSTLDDPADGAADQDDSSYRLVLLDCPPSLGLLTRSALVAADRALLITEPTIYAVAGVQRAFEAVQHEREHNPHLQAMGVVVNRARVRSSEHNYRINELHEIFGPLMLPTVLPDRSAVQHAQGAGLPIQRWGTPGAREIAVAYDVLLARMLRTTQLRRRTEAQVATAAARNHRFDA